MCAPRADTQVRPYITMGDAAQIIDPVRQALVKSAQPLASFHSPFLVLERAHNGVHRQFADPCE